MMRVLVNLRGLRQSPSATIAMRVKGNGEFSNRIPAGKEVKHGDYLNSAFLNLIKNKIIKEVRGMTR